MSPWVVGGGIYTFVAVIALAMTGILRLFWEKLFLDAFPMMITGFWKVYPGRKWPGPLKLVGYPMTMVFLLTVATIFIVFELLMLLAISPKAIWWAAQRVFGHRRGGPGQPPSAAAAKMRAAG